MLAHHFFKDGDIDKEEELTFADLNREYLRILVPTVFVLLATAFAMWLIGYEILKFLGVFICADGLWTWTGCLKKEGTEGSLMEFVANNPEICM